MKVAHTFIPKGGVPEGHPVFTRSAIIAVIAIAGVVALTVSGCSPSEPKPTETRKASTPAATRTPAPKDEVISGSWQTFDRVLVSDDIFQGFTTTGVIKSGVKSIPLYVPGDGPQAVAISADTGTGELQRQTLNVGGPDGSLMLIVATTTRMPAHGLDKAQAHNQLDSYDVKTGRHLSTYVFDDSKDEGLAIWKIAASRGDIVAVDFGESYLGKSITGVNMRTGKKVWDKVSNPDFATRYISATSYGTFATISNTGGKPADANSCYRADGFDIVTGKMLWSVDAAQILDTGSSLGDCTRLRVEPMDQTNTYRGQSDSTGSYFEVVLGMSSGYNDGDTNQYRVFDGTTGKQLADINISGYIDLLGGYAAHQPGNGLRGPLEVKSVTTGQTTYTASVQQQDDLDLRLQDVFGGYIYMKTSDGSPIVDVATGKVVADNTTNMPRQTVGKYTLYSDGTLSLDPHLGAVAGKGNPTPSTSPSR